MPYFGRGSYGIEAASRAYFDKPAADLALYQVAFIVSLINKPALPDRSFAMDPLLKTRDEIVDANWSEAARGTLRVLGLMLEQGAITELDAARATTLVEKSLRKEIVAPGRACGVRDHFLERVRVLYKDRFPINTGGLTISITRDDALQDVLAKAVDLTLRTYVARHPDDPDNNLLRAGAFAVDFSGDVLAEVGNVNFKDLKYDIMASGWRQPGSTFKIFTYGALVERLTKQVLAEKPSVENPTGRRVAGPRALQRARRAVLRVARTRPRREEDREFPLAVGAAVPRRDDLPDRAGRVAQHGGDARRGQRGHQERHRSRVSRGHAEGSEAHASTLPDDGDRRFGGEPARRWPRRPRSSMAAFASRRASPMTFAAKASRCCVRMPTTNRPIATSRERSAAAGARDASRRIRGDDRAAEGVRSISARPAPRRDCAAASSRAWIPWATRSGS